MVLACQNQTNLTLWVTVRWAGDLGHQVSRREFDLAPQATHEVLMDEVPSTLDLDYRSTNLDRTKTYGIETLPLLGDKSLAKLQATLLKDDILFEGQHKPFPFILLVPSVGLVMGIAGLIWLSQARRRARRN